MSKLKTVNLQGKEFILFESLLELFFENGGASIDTQETETSTADCPKFKALVIGKKGSFTGHGDADNSNVNTMVAKHKYRMAETRAIARALRWYNNIGMCSADELGEGVKETKTKKPQKMGPAWGSKLNQRLELLEIDPRQLDIAIKGKIPNSIINFTLEDVKRVLKSLEDTATVKKIKEIKLETTVEEDLGEEPFGDGFDKADFDYKEAKENK